MERIYDFYALKVTSWRNYSGLQDRQKDGAEPETAIEGQYGEGEIHVNLL